MKIDDKYWYVFDDDKIQKVEHNDVIKTHRNDSIKHTPCILFYELIENNNDEKN